MTSTNLNHAQQAAALHLFQTLCAYPGSNLSQEFQQLAQSLPTDGQATLDRLAPLAAFFKKQGIEMGEFVDVAESLLESPAAWAGFADHCVYTLMTGNAGSDIPSSPGGQVVFDRASASPSTDNDGYAIAYSAPDGSTTPLHYTNGQLVSNPEQANPAINLCATYAPNGPSSAAPAVQPVLYGSINGQQAIGLNLDETGSDDQSIWKKSGQFIKDHWKGISIGGGITVVVVVIIVLVVKYIRRANVAGGQVEQPQHDINQFLDPQEENPQEVNPQEDNPIVEQIPEEIHNIPVINDLQQVNQEIQQIGNNVPPPVHHEDPQIPNNLPEINQDPIKQKIIHLSDVVKKKGVDYLGRKEVLNQNDKYWILENIGGDEYVNAFKEQYKDQIIQKRIFEDLADKIGSQAMEIYSTSRNMTNIQMQSTMDVDRLRELDPFNEQENQEFITQMKDVVYPNQRKILSLQKDLTAEYKEAKSADHLKQQQAIQDALNKIPTLDPHDSDNVNGQIQEIKNGKVDRQNLDKKPPVQQQKSPDNLAQPQTTTVQLQQEFDQWAKQNQLQRDKFAKFENQFDQWKSQANRIQNPTAIPEKFQHLKPEDIRQAVKNVSLLDDNALDDSSNQYHFVNKELDWLEQNIGDKPTIKEFNTGFDSMIMDQRELNTLTQMLQAELRQSLKDGSLNLSTIYKDIVALDSLDTIENTEREAVIQQIMDNMRTRQEEVDLKQSDESLKKTIEPSDPQHSVPVWKTIKPEDLINHVKDYAYYTDPNNNRRDHIRKYFKDINNKSEEYARLRHAIDKPFNIQKDINQMINNFEAIENGDYLGENTKTIIKSEKEILKHINPFNPTTEDVIIDLYDRHIQHWKTGTKNDHIFNDKDFQAFDQSMQQRKAAKNEQHEPLKQMEKVQKMETAVVKNASQFAQNAEYGLAQMQEQQLLKQNQEIRQLQQVSNTPDARRLMQENLQEQQQLNTDNFQDPLSGANQLIREEQQILQTNQQVNINEKQHGLTTDKTTQHIKDQQQQPIKDKEEKGKKASEKEKGHEVLHFEE